MLGQVVTMDSRQGAVSAEDAGQDAVPMSGDMQHDKNGGGQVGGKGGSSPRRDLILSPAQAPTLPSEGRGG